MHLVPILSTLRRHRTAALLIVLEIALTCAIVCNAIFVIGDRLASMHRPSGCVENELVTVRLTGIGKGTDASAVTAADLRALRALPGVKDVVASDMEPFGNNSWNTDVSTRSHDPNGLNVAYYVATPRLVGTFGLHLIAGRDFTPEEYVAFDDVEKKKVHVPSAILTRALADRLYPHGDAVGKPVYAAGDDPQIVVGIVDTLARPNDVGGAAGRGLSIILPVRIAYDFGDYVLRVDPSQRAAVLAAVDGVLNKVDPNRIILGHDTFPEIRAHHFRQDRAMAYLLIGVCIALLVITALGIVGLASFWVQQRTRQIGIRRALGATRGDIRRYFQLENFILATVGIIVGMGLAYGINLWLMDKYQVARLPATFLPIGAVLLWTLGQIAVLGPARRASRIAPAIATRTV